MADLSIVFAGIKAHHHVCNVPPTASTICVISGIGTCMSSKIGTNCWRGCAPRCAASTSRWPATTA